MKFMGGRYKSRTGSTRQSGSDQLGSTRIVSDHEKNIKLNAYLWGATCNYQPIVPLTETLYCLNSAHPPKIHGWVLLVCGNFSVKMRVCSNKQFTEKVGFCLFSVSNFTFGCHNFRLKKLEIIQYNF